MKLIKNPICIGLGILLCSGISGCGFDKEEEKKVEITPTQVVSQALDDLQSGDSDKIQNMLSENLPVIIKVNSGLKELLPLSYEKIEAIPQNITYTINNESVENDEAVVNVTVSGPDLNEPFNKCVSNVVNDIKSGEINIRDFNMDKLSVKYDSELSELMKDIKTTERTGNIKLNKKNGKWIVDLSDLCQLSLNINPDDYSDISLVDIMKGFKK